MTTPATRFPRFHPAILGAVTLIASIALLAGTGVAVVRAAHDGAATNGLSYGTLGADLRTAFAFAPVESWVRVDTVAAVLGGRSVVVDTLAVIADTNRFPAFRRGGFLHDQVRAFNRHQRFRLDAAVHAPALLDSLAPHNPSIFRSGRTERGEPVVLRVVNVQPMRVPSPFEELWRGRVLADAGPPAPALVAREGMLSLAEADSVQDAACRVERQASLVRFYCASRERRPQLTLRLAADAMARGTARVGWSPRAAPFRYDGAAGIAGDTLFWRGGGIVSLAGLPPSVFARVEPGLISSTQWVNGRVRRVDAAPPGLEFLGALGTRAAARGSRGGGDVTLRVSLDAALSRALTDSLRRATAGLPLDGAAVVLADAATGAVIATGETGTRLTPDAGWLVRPLSVGSAVKPILAAAILAERPQLASLRVRAEPVVTRLFGHPVGEFASHLNCGAPADGWIDLAYFIRCSNNQYAAALVLAGLADGTAEGMTLTRGETAPWELNGTVYTDRRPALPVTGGWIARDRLAGSALADGLLRAFNLDADVLVADSRGRNAALWNGLAYSNGVALRPPRALQPEVSRPSLVERAERGTSPALLATYAYGGWGNQWTLLDLVQAYARVLTGRRVLVTLTPGGVRDGGDPTNPDEQYGSPLGWTRRPWYRTLTGALGDVAETGTASGLAADWRRQLGDGVAVYAKTGTLNERDDRLYLRALAFGVGRRDARTGAALECGVVGVVYVKLRELPQGSATVPPLHTDFARRVVGPLLRQRWGRRPPCESGAGEGATR